MGLGKVDTGPSKDIYGRMMGAGERMARTGETLTSMGIPATGAALDYFTKLASGEPGAVMAAVAPAIAKVAPQFQAARESVFSQVPRGAGQEFALSQVPIQQAATTAGLMGEAVTGAPRALGELGLGTGQLGLGAEQVGQYAYQTAEQIQERLRQEQAQRKASTLAFLGKTAGTVGSIVAAPFTGGTSLAAVPTLWSIPAGSATQRYGADPNYLPTAGIWTPPAYGR